MAKLTARTRAKLPSSVFALPGRRFPIHDKTHARVAKSYASRMAARGQLTPAQKAAVFAKADRKLGLRMAAGGRVGMRLGGAMFKELRKQERIANARAKNPFVTAGDSIRAASHPRMNPERMKRWEAARKKRNADFENMYADSLRQARERMVADRKALPMAQRIKLRDMEAKEKVLSPEEMSGLKNLQDNVVPKVTGNAAQAHIGTSMLSSPANLSRMAEDKDENVRKTGFKKGGRVMRISRKPMYAVGGAVKKAKKLKEAILEKRPIPKPSEAKPLGEQAAARHMENIKELREKRMFDREPKNWAPTDPSTIGKYTGPKTQPVKAMSAEELASENAMARMRKTPEYKGEQARQSALDFEKTRAQTLSEMKGMRGAAPKKRIDPNDYAAGGKVRPKISRCPTCGMPTMSRVAHRCGGKMR